MKKKSEDKNLEYYQEKELMTANEVMQMLGISRTNFDSLVKDGTLKAYRLKKKIYCKYSEIMDSLKRIN